MERKDYEPVLQGLVDFDLLSAAPMPGTPYRARIPFRGLVASTYFNGQVPILRRNGPLTYGANYGLPAHPLDVASVRSSK